MRRRLADKGAIGNLISAELRTILKARRGDVRSLFPTMDKLRAIKFFCRVAEVKSFAVAAHDLDVVPSVLSKTIASLEDDIAFRLFNRTTRRVSLTEDGARYYERCKRLVVELEEAELLTRAGADRVVGRLSAGLHPSINRVLLTRINEFLAAYPDISLETTTTSLVSTLVEDRLDVLIALGDLPDSNFGAQKIGMTHFVLVATPAYLRRHGIPEIPTDLGNHTVIVSARRDSPSFVHWPLSRGNEKETVYAPARMICREGVHMHEACLSGAGICRMVEVAARPCVARGDLKRVLPDWSFDPLPIRAVFPSRNSVPAKARAFVNFVRAILKEKEWWSTPAGERDRANAPRPSRHTIASP
jgi:LysR family transcriptional regulator, regulator for bpeEF and oprC